MVEISKNQLMKIQESLIENEDEIDVAKFHQRTCWNYINDELSHSLLRDYYADSISKVNTHRPEHILQSIKLDTHSFEAKGSSRNFVKKTIPFKVFSEVIIESFGENEHHKRRYPSAGALYSIIPIILVLDNDVVDSIKKGVYIFDYETLELLLIKEITDNFIEEFLKSIGGGEIISYLLFAYSIDLSKSIAKYKTRGYRHAVMEVGALSQNVRNTLHKKGLSELCWSGFNDNSITKLLSMNVRKAPILLIQWWGYDAVQ